MSEDHAEALERARLALLAMERACFALIETVEATGGLAADGTPVADSEWLDLGYAYADACAPVGQKPMIEGGVLPND